jgi:hypothetical protein
MAATTELEVHNELEQTLQKVLDKDTVQRMTETRQLEQVMQKVIVKLTEQQQNFDIIAQQLCRMELRQFNASGDMTDAVRALHRYAIGESLCMPENACKTICQVIMMGEQPTQWQVVLNRYLRRCQYELLKFFQVFCNNNEQAVVTTEHIMGELVVMLPGMRAQLVQCEKAIESKIPELDENLIELYKLAMPMNRFFRATTVAELMYHNILPEHCMYKTLDVEEAKLVFEKLKKKYPKLVHIESVPLPPIQNDKYETWHTQLLRQICSFNVHSVRVVNAKNIIKEDLFLESISQIDIPETEATAELEAKFMHFLGRTDAAGNLSINLAQDIRKRRHDEAAFAVKKPRTKGEGKHDNE